MTVQKSTLQRAYESLRVERFNLIEKAIQEVKLPVYQEEINELNDACEDILRGIYPVVSMAQIAEKLAKYPNTRITIKYDTTSLNVIESIDEVNSETVYFTYNGTQKDTNERGREFFVTSNKGNSITVVPVEFWYCNIY